MRVSDLPHLIRRFFESVRSRWPSPADQRFVAGFLSLELAAAFHRQHPMDQSHAVGCARRVVAAAPGRPDLVRAALLHDVGKQVAHLGVLGRSLASVASILHLPRTGRMQEYLDHGTIGADLLAALGEGGIVTAFAAHHHGLAPEGIDAGDWRILLEADRSGPPSDSGNTMTPA